MHASHFRHGWGEHMHVACIKFKLHHFMPLSAWWPTAWVGSLSLAFTVISILYEVETQEQISVLSHWLEMVVTDMICTKLSLNFLKQSTQRRFIGLPLFSTDINECSSGIHRCDQDCTNTDGSYTCSCRVGYTLNTDRLRCDGEMRN